MKVRRILSFLTAMSAALTTGLTFPAKAGSALTSKAAETPMWADANESGGVNVADAVAVLQYISNHNKYPLSEQGLINADVVDPGQGVTGMDAIAIQMVDANIITVKQLPISAAGIYYLLDDHDTVKPTEAPAEGTTGAQTEEPTEAAPEETTEPTIEEPAEPTPSREEVIESLSEEYRQIYLSNPLAVIRADMTIPMIYGDLDNSMSLNASDLTLLKRSVMNNDPYDEKADLDGDGDVDADDITLLRDYLMTSRQCFPVYANYDSDDDGINDYIEMELFGTDSRNADTDGDGLSDFDELLCFNTNPKKADSIKDGVSDADCDSDGDGLTNIEEKNIGTDPMNKDTDGDGLDDYSEMKTLKTDPVNADTDGDGISDFEEKELGLDPNKAATNGTPDNERIFTQVIPADDPIFKNINTEDNAYDLSVEIRASGYAKRNLFVGESGYSYILKDSSAIGVAPEFVYNPDFKVESITLNFEIKEPFRDNVSHYFDLMDEDADYYNYEFQVDTELLGIKRLNVFKYFQSVNLAMPIYTEYDVDNNIVSVTIDTFETDDEGNSYGIGSYSLVDLEVWGKMMNNAAEEETQSGVVTDAQGFMRPASNVQINGPWFFNPVTVKLKTISDAVRFLLEKNYRSHIVPVENTRIERPVRNLDSLFGHKYAYYSASGISYSAAAAACRAKGGHLMTVTSPMEYGFLSGTLSAGKSGAIWLGASGGPGSWSWCTGESTSYARTIKAYGYSMDTCGSYFSGVGNCLVYYSGLAYPTGSRPAVSNVSGYICEWEPGAFVNDDDAHIYSLRVGGSAIAGLSSRLSSTSNADSDGDGIKDWNEVDQNAIAKINGKTGGSSVSWRRARDYVAAAKLTGKQIADTADKINAVFTGDVDVTPVISNLEDVDSDGDGILDSDDLSPGSAFSKIFVLSDYSTDGLDLIPNGVRNTYNSLMEEYGKFSPEDLKEFNWWIADLTQFATSGGALLGAASPFPGKVLNDEWARMPHAAAFLAYYNSNLGIPYRYDGKEPIARTFAGRKNFNGMMNKMMEAAEETLKDGGHMCIATNIDRSGLTQEESDTITADFYSYHNHFEFDWCYSVGKCTSALVADITRDGDSYTAKFKYYIIDLYDWDRGDESPLHYLHKCGISHAYYSLGEYEKEFTWKKSKRFKDVVNNLETLYSGDSLVDGYAHIGELDFEYLQNN